MFSCWANCRYAALLSPALTALSGRPLRSLPPAAPLSPAGRFGLSRRELRSLFCRALRSLLAGRFAVSRRALRCLPAGASASIAGRVADWKSIELIGCKSMNLCGGFNFNLHHDSSIFSSIFQNNLRFFKMDYFRI